MNESGFRNWLLSQGYNAGTTNSRVSNCVRVCEFEGDIDVLYANDKCKELLFRLTYTTEDERQSRQPRHSVPINGNIRNGTATLKQATGLYIRYLEDYCKTVIPETPVPIIIATVKKSKEINVPKVPTTEIVDSYAQFLDYFGIDTNTFYNFGLDNTIFSEPEYALTQWSSLKEQLLDNQPLTIRGYGRQGKHTDLFFELYKYLFSNSRIKEDGTNNAVPRRNIQAATGHRINKTLLNYQCSHIFGHTKNPLLFEAVWNICFTPKMFDPLTGHEAKGIWPEEYQQLFIAASIKRYHECITDYNAFIIEHKISTRIHTFVSSLAKKYDESLLRKFQEDALYEWQTIVYNKT